MRCRYTVALALLCLLASVCVLGAVVLATDNFTRANQNPLAGNWATILGFSPLQLISDSVEGTAVGVASAAAWTGSSFPVSQYSEITLSTNAFSEACVRGSVALGTLGYCAVLVNNGSFPFGTSGVVDLVGNGHSYSAQIVSPVPLSAGVPIRMSIQADVFGLTISGTPILLNQDDSILGGQPTSAAAPQATLNDTVIASWAGGFEGTSQFNIGNAFGFGMDATLTTVSGSYPLPTPKGDLLVCLTGGVQAGSSPTITSTQDGTWNLLATQLTAAGAVFDSQVFWVHAGGGSGVNTVTFSQTGAGHMVVSCGDYAFKNAAVDQQIGVSTTSNISTATLTTTAPNEIMIGYIANTTDSPQLGLNGAAYRFGWMNEIKLYDMAAGTAGPNTLAAAIGNVGTGELQTLKWQEILVSFTGEAVHGGTTASGPTKVTGPTTQY
jgi:hypothetical protein